MSEKSKTSEIGILLDAGLARAITGARCRRSARSGGDAPKSGLTRPGCGPRPSGSSLRPIFPSARSAPAPASRADRMVVERPGRLAQAAAAPVGGDRALAGGAPGGPRPAALRAGNDPGDVTLALGLGRLTPDMMVTAFGTALRLLAEVLVRPDRGAATDPPTLRAALRAHIGRQIAAFDAALRGEGAAVIDSARVLRDLGGLKRLLDDVGADDRRGGRGWRTTATRRPRPCRPPRGDRGPLCWLCRDGRPHDPSWRPCRRRSLRALALDWLHQARPDQLPPPWEDDWTTWAVIGGRGCGKTRTGAEWVDALARGDPAFTGAAVGRIALVGETFADVRDVMVEGPSGLLGLPGARRAPALVAEPAPARMGQRRGGAGLLGGGARCAARPAIRRRVVRRARQVAPAGGHLRHAAIRAAARRPPAQPRHHHAAADRR